MAYKLTTPKPVTMVLFALSALLALALATGDKDKTTSSLCTSTYTFSPPSARACLYTGSSAVAYYKHAADKTHTRSVDCGSCTLLVVSKTGIPEPTSIRCKTTGTFQLLTPTIIACQSMTTSSVSVPTSTSQAASCILGATAGGSVATYTFPSGGNAVTIADLCPTDPAGVKACPYLCQEKSLQGVKLCQQSDDSHLPGPGNPKGLCQTCLPACRTLVHPTPPTTTSFTSATITSKPTCSSVTGTGGKLTTFSLSEGSPTYTIADICPTDAPSIEQCQYLCNQKVIPGLLLCSDHDEAVILPNGANIGNSCQQCLPPCASATPSFTHRTVSSTTQSTATSILPVPTITSTTGTPKPTCTSVTGTGGTLSTVTFPNGGNTVTLADACPTDAPSIQKCPFLCRPKQFPDFQVCSPVDQAIILPNGTEFSSPCQTCLPPCKPSVPSTSLPITLPTLTHVTPSPTCFSGTAPPPAVTTYVPQGGNPIIIRDACPHDEAGVAECPFLCFNRASLPFRICAQSDLSQNPGLPRNFCQACLPSCKPLTSSNPPSSTVPTSSHVTPSPTCFSGIAPPSVVTTYVPQGGGKPIVIRDKCPHDKAGVAECPFLCANKASGGSLRYCSLTDRSLSNDLPKNFCESCLISCNSTVIAKTSSSSTTSSTSISIITGIPTASAQTDCVPSTVRTSDPLVTIPPGNPGAGTVFRHFCPQKNSEIKDCPWICIYKPDPRLGGICSLYRQPANECIYCPPIYEANSTTESITSASSTSASTTSPIVTANSTQASCVSSTVRTEDPLTTIPPGNPGAGIVFRRFCPQTNVEVQTCPWVCLYKPDPRLGGICAPRREPANYCIQCLPICVPTNTTAVSTTAAPTIGNCSAFTATSAPDIKPYTVFPEFDGPIIYRSSCPSDPNGLRVCPWLCKTKETSSYKCSLTSVNGTECERCPSPCLTTSPSPSSSSSSTRTKSCTPYTTRTFDPVATDVVNGITFVRRAFCPQTAAEQAACPFICLPRPDANPISRLCTSVRDAGPGIGCEKCVPTCPRR